MRNELAETVRQLPDPATANSFVPYLPLFFTLKGKPLTMERHFPMEAIYQRRLPWRSVWKCARQVGKSQNVSASNIISAATTPYFQTLFVLPQFEMARRLSSNYVRPLITDSPVRGLLVDSKCEKSVLQKTLVNKSMMHFSFAFLDCERVRGLSVDRCNFDEVQAFDPGFIPIIAETMSASPYAISCYTGTAMTLDNTIELLWRDSSMAEWVIPCECGHYNIPTIEYDAEKMIGPVKNIALYGTGLVCAKCVRPIDARGGQWLPRFPEREPIFSGRHVPQIILPLHYTDEQKWAELLSKRETYLRAKFVNECLGESYDVGVRLVSLSDLRRASRLDWTVREALERSFRNRYETVVMGVDWGGGGAEGVSTTAIAVMGQKPDGLLETIYLERLPLNSTDEEERSRIYALYRHFRCEWFAHDFAGAGRVRDTAVRQDRIIAEDRILPMQYVATGARNLVVHHPPTVDSFRYFYSYDKTWSLSLILHLIKVERLLFPKPSELQDGLLNDFLSLTSEKRERAGLGDVYFIKRAGETPDDIVHAINFAAGAIFHVTQKFPDITESFRSAIATLKLQDDPDLGGKITHADWER